MSMNELMHTFLSKIAEQCHVELYGFELQSGKKNKKLVIYLDKDPSITSEDCEKFAKTLRATALVEFPALSQMLLEVSSPGVERQLFTLEHCRKSIGKKVKIKTKTAIEEQKNFIGKLTHVNDNDNTIEVILEENADSKPLNWDNIDKVRIIYEGKS